MKIPLSLIILYIDFFKKINDTYGHPGGDACLRAMGSLIQSKITRAGDIVARFGGEEFVILLPDCDLQNAVKFAESLRAQVQQMQVQFNELTICFTASFGVACGSPASSFNTEMMLSQADTALYQAKHDGRNCVRTLADTQ
jgi:diguanylate cyclase (GGDEF)-like protein